MPKRSEFYSKILGLRARYLDAVRGNEALLKIIREAEVPDLVYNSNAIENSTLSLEETERILLEIDLDRFISQRELFETKNLARVVDYIDLKAKDSSVTLDFILLLHKMLLSNIRDEIAGRFRSEKEWVRVGTHIAPSPLEIVDRLEEMMKVYNLNPGLNIIQKLALQHLTFEYIHPFVDGNGRIGRVLLDCFLIKEGYVPINIKYSNRNQYYSAFEEFQSRNKTDIMEKIIGLALTNSYHKRLAYLERKRVVALKEYAGIAKTSLSNLINKAQRQTIEAFTEKGVWKIGV
ncbi:MAG TPA: Fic family protein [Oligoflexia bacterium]|nr:Fic family protein [Oligoflexia bacterium]HMP48945.1 Fic family protein [Oligoflexia bacterium]